MTWLFRIPEALVDAYDLRHQDGELKLLHQELEAEIKAWNEKWSHVLRGDSNQATNRSAASGASPGRANASQEGVLRVLCRPEFAETEAPIDPNRVFKFPEECVVAAEQMDPCLVLLCLLAFFQCSWL